MSSEQVAWGKGPTFAQREEPLGAHDPIKQWAVRKTQTFEILVVDDSPVQRKLLAEMLRSCGHPVLEAADGVEAFPLIQDRKIHMVFTDWLMPRMSGIELIRKIRRENLGFYVYVILCSAKDSRTDLLEGIRAGANDFLVKPARPEELIARLHAAEHVIELKTTIAEDEDELKKAYSSLSQIHDRLSSDLQAAANLQISLLPRPASFQGVLFDWVFRPANEVAGDIFNVFPLDPNHVGFYQLDVAGHGIPSAMLSFSLSKVLQATPLRESLLKRAVPEPPYYHIASPQEVAADLNVSFQNDEDLYFTLVYGVLDVTSGQLEFVQAGHPRPFLIPGNGPVRLLGGTGFPIAALLDVEFDLRKELLQPGDRLILSSDGAIECLNQAREQFGISRMTQCLQEARTQPMYTVIGKLVERLLDWRGRYEFDDDISLLAIEYLGPEQSKESLFAGRSSRE